MAYNVEYYCQFYDIGGTLHRFELLLKDYGGGATQLDFPKWSTPSRLRHQASREQFLDTIIQAQEMVFSFYIIQDDVSVFDALFESDYQDYKVRYYTNYGESNQILEFEGCVQPENLSKDFLKSPPHVEINLSATDDLATLKGIEFGDTLVLSKVMTLLEIIKEALTPTTIELDFIIQLGTYESTYMESDDCVLEEMKLDTRCFQDWGSGKCVIRSCWEVIEIVLKDFNVTLKQYQGHYKITNHYEKDSYEFEYDWNTLTKQSRTTTDNIIDISDCIVGTPVEQQKIAPLKEVQVTFRNKDLGGDVSGLDLNDWPNGAVWTIDFSSGYSVLSGIVTLISDDDAYDDYIETAEFSVAKVTDEDYLKVTFDHTLFLSTGLIVSPIIKITITRPGSPTGYAFFTCVRDKWKSYQSPFNKAFKITQSGDYSVKLSFKQIGGFSGWDTARFKIKNFRISRVINEDEEVIVDEEDGSITYDEEYRLPMESTSSRKVFQTETRVADGGSVSEVGALIFEDSAEHLTADWRTYGRSEDLSLINIYSRNILNDHYRYKNYLRLVIHDRAHAIGMDNVLVIDSRDYVFVSWDYDFLNCSIRAELIEMLTTQQFYNDIGRVALNSIDGEYVKSSVNSNQLAQDDLAGLKSMAYEETSDYYTQTQLDNGQLDNRYYTETELDNGQLDSRYYTETELDNGQLDNRYYTETEVDAWRNSVTQTEMGYLHGVTSGVQTQLSARAVIQGTPSDNQVATWTSATGVQGETNVIIDGSSNLQHPSFSQGFGGSNWRITPEGSAEFRDLLVSGSLKVYELILNRLHYQNGGLIVGAGGGKLATIVDDTIGSEVVMFEDPVGNGIIPFTEGAIVMVQDFDLDRSTAVKQIVRQVDVINSDGSVDLTNTVGWTPGESAGDDTDILAVGDVMVTIGHTSDTNYDANIYMSAVDANNPFIRIYDGVNSWEKWDLTDKSTIKVQIGNLASLANYGIVPASPGYGLYSSNVYLTGEIQTAATGTRIEIKAHEINMYEGTDLFAQLKTNAARGAGSLLLYDGATTTRVFPIGVDDGTDWLIQWDGGYFDFALGGYFDGNIRSTEVKKWSCPGIAFDAMYPDADDVSKAATGNITASANGIFLTAPVSLPNGAVVSAAEVFGNAGASGETWSLARINPSDASLNIMASAAINTEDTSISNATIDNETYAYFLYTSSIDTGDSIYGARITYTY